MTFLVAIIGPSGAGKSSVVRELERRGVVDVVPTWTTRPRRADEAHGSVEHRFVTDAEFDRLAAAGHFADVVQLFGLAHRYGLPAPEHHVRGDATAVVMVRAALVERLRTHVAVGAVYQIEDSPARLATRLARRGTSPRDFAARVHDNCVELADGRRVADRAFVNDASIAVLADRVTAAIERDRAAQLAGVLA